MTPWCSVSFNPIDGMFQASPYVISYFFVPCHYLTHLFLLFSTVSWHVVFSANVFIIYILTTRDISWPLLSASGQHIYMMALKLVQSLLWVANITPFTTP